MEWKFLLHLRESALGAVHCFLRYNSPALVTPDVTRRIVSLLSNALQFTNTYLSRRVEQNPDEIQSESKGLSLEGRELLLRSRIFQCFSLLGHSGITESIQGSLLQSTISLFASPDGYTGSSVQAAIASSTGSFTSVWQSVDGYAYGVTNIKISEGDEVSGPAEWLNRDSIEIAIDSMVGFPDFFS